MPVIDPPVVPPLQAALRPSFLGTTDEDPLAFMRSSGMPGRRRRYSGMAVFRNRSNCLICKEHALSFHGCLTVPAY